MRPAAVRQSALVTPLNDVLGTEANVRTLRVLANATVPLSRAELAQAAALHPSGIPRVLQRLEDIGVIEVIGRGRSRPIRLRAEHSLAPQLKALFIAERDRARSILDNIRGAITLLEPRPNAAWIEGPVATDSDRFEDAIVIGLLAETKDAANWEQRLRVQLSSTQRQNDVAIEIRIRWRADVLAASPSDIAILRHARPLVGPAPLVLLGVEPAEVRRPGPRGLVSHDVHDQRALELAQHVADQLKTRPDLVSDALAFIERRMPSASTGEQLELREWEDILNTYSLGRLRSFLISPSERATRLRQSLPFVKP